ncbi:hypothetical protein P7C71_g2239, partial [Lecanoromycetidae sp. Uapishka_2]
SSNIDRLFALYQALYPDKFVAKDDVQDWKKVGFATPGNLDLDEDGREIVKAYVRDNYYCLKYPLDLSGVEALRGDSATVIANPTQTFTAIESDQHGSARLVEKIVSLSGDQKVVTVPKDVTTTAKEQIENEKNFPDGALQNVQNKKPTSMVTWDAHVKVKKYAFDGSFGIHAFIGSVNNDQPQHYMTESNQVGYSGIFASSSGAHCDNCNDQRALQTLYEDVIPITSTLVDYLYANPTSDGLIRDGETRTIPSLDNEPSVVRFLKEHLQWQVVDTASNPITDEQQLRDSGLEVKVVRRKFEVPTDENKLGLYSDPVVYQEITEGKLGGYGYQG